ncbi:dTDP-4-dehydrorhamnose 3,5-epimerase [Salisaeta longa]|uniref:dTDP-4-dehydrorhamnose 3,5-epimerase n=1 Tax=Salisaeta longa TaxID=503170 RepID=UPI0003B33293|nr:dTDP-4-dehydrorhamnose 3,5-epimerase [Salisaeta longa]
MTVTELSLSGVLLIEPDVYRDGRGYFMETWNRQTYAEHGLDVDFVQDNLSFSKHGVLRGLHFQNPYPQGKLVSVLRGEVFDVAVDLRANSDTFGSWEGVTLSANNGRQLYVPEGFAHGFVVTSADALFHYKCTNAYHPEAEGIVRWDDPEIDITWPVSDPVLSDRDAAAPRLREIDAFQTSMV